MGGGGGKGKWGVRKGVGSKGKWGCQKRRGGGVFNEIE